MSNRVRETTEDAGALRWSSGSASPGGARGAVVRAEVPSTNRSRRARTRRPRDRAVARCRSSTLGECLHRAHAAFRDQKRWWSLHLLPEDVEPILPGDPVNETDAPLR